MAAIRLVIQYGTVRPSCLVAVKRSCERMRSDRVRLYSLEASRRSRLVAILLSSMLDQFSDPERPLQGYNGVSKVCDGRA